MSGKLSSAWVQWVIVTGLVVFALLATSCSKQKGYVYKTNYTTKNGWMDEYHVKKYVTTNFFTIDVQDSATAVHYYMNSEAYRHSVDMGMDSLWVEYYCTLEEWREKGR
jgi:hypothetical protein